MIVRASVRGVVIGALLALLAWSAPAAAQGDPESQLRQLITGIQSFVATQSGDMTLRTSRPPETRMDGATAIATLADVTLAGRNGNALELGTMTLSRREVEPGRLRYELTLPERIRAVERSGGAPLTITSGGGTLALVSDAVSGLPLEVDFRISELHVPPQTPDARDATLGMLQLGGAISARADGLSDFVARILVRGLRVVRPGAGVSSVGEISVAFGVQGFRLEDLERIRSAFAEGAAAGPAAGWRRAMERLQALLQNGAVTGVTGDLTVATGAYNDGNPAPAVTFGRARFGVVMTGANQATGAYQLRYEHDGLALRQGLVPLPQYIPSRVNLNLAFEQVPIRELNALSAASVAAAGVNNAAIGARMVQAMIQAGTTVRIAPIDVAAPAVGGTLNGSITFETRSPLLVRGSGELVVRGLEAVQRDLAAQGGRGADSPAGVVAMLTALGQQGTGSDGQPVRSYRIELAPEGQLMLNGTDMTALLGPAAAPRPGRAPGAQPSGR